MLHTHTYAPEEKKTFASIKSNKFLYDACNEEKARERERKNVDRDRKYIVFGCKGANYKQIFFIHFIVVIIEQMKRKRLNQIND